MQLIIKRAFDLLIAFSVLVAFLPILVIISIMIYFIDGSPVFFLQDRPGLNENIFKIIKFRTMRIQKANQELSDMQRLTHIGQYLRKYSLDEVPQLLNVLKGELSIVGPRPLLVEYLPLYSARQKKRHTVKPGITGWAQINGRNAIDWESKFELDIWYVENWSLLLDLKIIILTFAKIFKPSGINASNDVTMDKFKGIDS